MNRTTFVAAFSAIAVSAAQDVFEIVAASNRRVEIREIRLGQYSDAGDAAAELLSITIVRGYTVSGSGGSTITPAPLKTRAPCSTTVERNNTTVANTGTVQILLADSFNVAGGFRYYPVPEERIFIDQGQRLVVRISAPADEITLNGTLVFDELHD